MRRRIIIATTVLSMILCLSLLGYSVYAHLNQSFSISNTIGFNPSQNVYVSLECSVSGARQLQTTDIPDGYTSLDDYFEDMGFIHKEEFNSEDKILNKPQILQNWQIRESLEFIDFETPIVYTIRVYNYSDMAIKISVEDYVTSSNYFVNTPSEPVVIEGLKQGQEPSWKEITLTTNIKDRTNGFQEEKNDFKILLETVD